jgi:hypothetical protein
MLCFVTGFPCWWLWAASSSKRTLPILSINYKGLRIWEHWRNGSVNIAICILMLWFVTHNRRHILHYNMVLYYPDGKRKFCLEHVTWKLYFSEWFMKNILFEQRRIKLWNKCHFIENKTEIKRHALKMQQIFLLPKHIKWISGSVSFMDIHIWNIYLLMVKFFTWGIYVRMLFLDDCY